MTKSRNLFKNISIFFCLVPMLLLSILCLVPQSKYDTYADYTVSDFTFVGSNIITTSTHYRLSTSSYQPWHFTQWSTSLSYSTSNGYVVSVSGVCMAHLKSDSFGDAFNISGYSTFTLNNNGYSSGIVFANLSGETDYRVNFFVYISGNFNGQVAMIEIFNRDQNETIQNGFRYYDTANNYVEIYCPSYYGTNTTTKNTLLSFALTNRTYYTNVDLSNNGYYQSGYTDGYNAGVSDGSSGGYKDGYDAGVIDGYNNGYNAGLNNANQYTFNNLFGAIIDTPISAFTSLLNFNFLGINLLSFVTGLLTLSIVIFIVKLCLGGK